MMLKIYDTDFAPGPFPGSETADDFPDCDEYNLVHTERFQVYKVRS
jgi:hypothetical protein